MDPPPPPLSYRYKIYGRGVSPETHLNGAMIGNTFKKNKGGNATEMDGSATRDGGKDVLT